MRPHQLVRTTDRETSKHAANNRRVHVSQCELVYRLYEADRDSGGDGLTADEVCEFYDKALWRRVSELTKDGMLKPKMRNGREVTRITRQGKPGTVMVLA